MRLWHIDLIPYLPNTQLIAQWRELNCIYKEQNKHILINYIYDYSKDYLYNYSKKVMWEMGQRGIEIKSYQNFKDYFLNNKESISNKAFDRGLRYKEHNSSYLLICFMNLYEKYKRGQKDFTPLIFNNLYNYCKNILKESKYQDIIN